MIELKSITNQHLLLSLGSRVCPIAGCQKRQRETFCGPHYRSLPGPLKKALYAHISTGKYGPAVTEAMRFLNADTFHLPAGLFTEPGGGSLDVLNCGAGHLEFRFAKGLASEEEKARKVIQDMMKRGYAIFVEIDGQHHRVKEFDPKHDHYVIDEVPAAEIADAPAAEIADDAQPKKRRIPMKRAKATGIAPTAGG